MKFFDDIKEMFFPNKDAEFNFDEELKIDDQIFKEMLKKQDELHAIQQPIFHFIYRLNFRNGSIFNLEDLQGWFNFTDLHFSMYYRPTSYFSIDLKANSSVENAEVFLLPKILRSYNEISGRCEFEDIQFDVWTNGLDFEIVLYDKTHVNLENLSEIFGRWTSQILLDSLDLTSKLDTKFEEFRLAELQKSAYDYILNLEYYSFIVITCPETKEYQDSFEKSELKKISENIWINEEAYIKSTFYPPFNDFKLYLLGHVYKDNYYDVLDILTAHLKFWVMYDTLDNFAGLLTSIKEIQVRANVKKTDFLNSLFGRKIMHEKMDYLDGIKSRLDRLLMFGLENRSRGFEYEQSDDFLISQIAGKYLDLFNETPSMFSRNNIKLTKEIFINFEVESEKVLIEQYRLLMNDLKNRINETLLSINKLENDYYRSYELGLNLKAQEWTFISIVVAVLLFVIQFIYN